MIVKETTIMECWCTTCGQGQVAKLHDLMRGENKTMGDLSGRGIVCDHCGSTNIIEDILHVIPTAFIVSSQSDKSKVKANYDLLNWLESERK